MFWFWLSLVLAVLAGWWCMGYGRHFPKIVLLEVSQIDSSNLNSEGRKFAKIFLYNVPSEFNLFQNMKGEIAAIHPITKQIAPPASSLSLWLESGRSECFHVECSRARIKAIRALKGIIFCVCAFSVHCPCKSLDITRIEGAPRAIFYPGIRSITDRHDVGPALESFNQNSGYKVTLQGDGVCKLGN